MDLNRGRFFLLPHYIFCALFENEFLDEWWGEGFGDVADDERYECELAEKAQAKVDDVVDFEIRKLKGEGEECGTEESTNDPR